MRLRDSSKDRFINLPLPHRVLGSNKDLMQLTTNFALKEFTCKDGTAVPEQYMGNVKELANNLQNLREYLGTPVYINSGYRTPTYNKSVEGSALHSQHMLAKAADVTSPGWTPKQIAGVINDLIANGRMKQGGIGRYSSFTHYDIRGTAARWGKSK